MTSNNILSFRRIILKRKLEEKIIYFPIFFLCCLLPFCGELFLLSLSILSTLPKPTYDDTTYFYLTTKIGDSIQENLRKHVKQHNIANKNHTCR